MPGIKDVAERAGLSIATVSRALSGKGNVSPRSRERARAAASELGFVLSYHASSLASGRNHNVGVVVPSVHRWLGRDRSAAGHPPSDRGHRRAAARGVDHPHQ
jgi:DNA-binding LacI/PurR family transcriptional regulator